MAYKNLLDQNFVLTQNIDTTYTSNWNSGKGFNPIGYYKTLGDNDTFTGTFDGGSFTLSNLTIDRATDNIGLFGYNFRGTIKDITLDSVDITGDTTVGGLVGFNFNGTIENSNSYGNVEGQSYVGGLVGYHISGSYSSDTWCTADAGSLSIIGGGKNNVTDAEIIMQTLEHESCQ